MPSDKDGKQREQLQAKLQLAVAGDRFAEAQGLLSDLAKLAAAGAAEAEEGPQVVLVGAKTSSNGDPVIEETGTLSWCDCAKDTGRICCIGLVSILKAASGQVIVPRYHKALLERAEITNHALQQYFTWRLGSLFVAVIFYAVLLVMQGTSMNATLTKKAELLSSFPPDVKLFAATFPKHLAWGEIFDFCFRVASALCVFVAAFTWRRYRVSRFLVWLAWFLGFVAPFMVMLVWPYRQSVDWRGVIENLCQKTVLKSVSSDPTMKLVFDAYAKINPNLKEWADGVTPDAAKAFCKQNAYDWQAKWFGSPKSSGHFMQFLQASVDQCLSWDFELYSNGTCTKQDCKLHPCLLGLNMSNFSVTETEAGTPARRAAEVPVAEGGGEADGGNYGEWGEILPGERCDAAAGAAACSSEALCRWDEWGAHCLRNESLAETQGGICLVLSGNVSACEEDRDCQWNPRLKYCESPFYSGMVGNYHFMEIEAQLQSWGDTGAFLNQFYFQSFAEVVTCYKNTTAWCSLEMVGDGQCNLECMNPLCMYDALDCCGLFEVDCGLNATSRNDVMSEVYRVGLELYLAGGEELLLRTIYGNVEDEAYQEALAEEYGLKKDDLKATDWRDMDASAAEEFGDDPEGVDVQIASAASALVRSVNKATTLRTAPDVVEAAYKKVERLKTSVTAEVTRAVKKQFEEFEAEAAFEAWVAAGGQPGRRLANEEARMKDSIGQAVQGEIQKFLKEKMAPLRTAAVSVMMLNVFNLMAQASQVATNLFKKAEYLLGVLMGLYSLKQLFPLTLGILGGLTKGIINVHNLLPATVIGGYLEVVVVASTLPMFAAFLATIYQVVGVVYILPGVLLLIFYLAMPGVRVYLYSFITDYMDRKQVRKADSRLSLIQNLFLLLALVNSVWYITGLNGLDGFSKEFVKGIRVKQLFVVQVIYTKAVTMCSVSLMTSVAAADAIISIEGATAAHYRNMTARSRDHLDTIFVAWSANLHRGSRNKNAVQVTPAATE